MTFDDEITPAHYQDLLDLSYDRRFKLTVRFGLVVIVSLFGAVAAAIGMFFYAAFTAVEKKGFSGVMMEPWILFLIGLGLVVSALGLFYLCFSQKNIRQFWKHRRRISFDDRALQEGLNLGQATFTLNEDGVLVDMPLDEDRLKWSAFTHFRETSDTLLMMFNERIGMVIPKAKLLATGQLDAARSLISTHVPAEG